MNHIVRDALAADQTGTDDLVRVALPVCAATREHAVPPEGGRPAGGLPGDVPNVPIRHTAHVVNANGVKSPQKLFVSYAGPDRDYAAWVTHTLRAEGYQVKMDADWATGANFVLQMSDALAGSDRMVCLFSEAYFDRARFTTDEWTAVLADRDRAGRLVPLLLERVTVPAVLRPLIYKDMVGLDESGARAALLEAVGGRPASTTPPPFPAR